MLKLIILLCFFNFLKCSGEVQLRGKECFSTNVTDHTTNTRSTIDKICKNDICIYRRCPYINMALIVRGKKLKCTFIEEINKITNRTIKLPDNIYKNYKNREKSGKHLFTDFRHVSFNDQIMYSKNCRQDYIYEEKSTEAFKILEDGKIYLQKSFKGDLIKDPGNYIMEFLVVQDKNEGWVIRKIVLLFLPIKKPSEAMNSFVIIGYGISSVFLVLTLLVYIFLKKYTLVNLLIMGHLSCLAVGLATKSIQMATFKADLLTNTGCTILCSTWYYAILASIFWMNVMAIDSFLRFRRKINTMDTNRRCAIRKFFKYGIYAMGIPLLLVCFAITVDMVNIPDDMDFKKPHLESCFPSATNIYYLSIPIAIILLWNLLLFLLTSFEICWDRRTISRTFSKADNKSVHKNRRDFYIYIKLMIVTGANWILDLVELVLPLPECLKYVFNSNVAIGVAIFIIFVLNDVKVMRRLFRRNPENEGQSERPSTKTSFQSTGSHQQPKMESSTAVTT